MNWIDAEEKETYMLIIILEKYKMYIKTSFKKLKHVKQSTKGNNKKTKYKIKKFSCTISAKHCQNQVTPKHQNLHLSKMK